MPFLTLASTTIPEIVIDLLLILAAAAVVGLAGARLRLALIPAYLITGVLIGPSVLGLVQAADRIDAIGELALILLMFGIGLHIDLGSFRGALLPMATVGVVSTLLTTTALLGVALAFGLNLYAAAVTALATSMSSTAVVLKILQQRRELKRVTGRLVFATLLVQDLAAVVILAALPPLAMLAAHQGVSGTSDTPVIVPSEAIDVPHGTTIWLRLLIRGAVALGSTLLLLAFTRYVLPRAFAEAARARADEVMLVLSAAAAIGAAVLTGAVGLSPALGAFLAGLTLASTPFRYQIGAQLGSIRDLFMAVFFVALGLSVQVAELRETWWAVLIGVAALVVIKGAGIAIAAWASGATGPVAAGAGAALAQGGEFSLVILAAAHQLNLIESRDHAAVVCAVIISLIFAPMIVGRSAAIARLARRVPHAPWVRRPVLAEPGGRHASPAAEPAVRHVVIAGFGPVGRAVADKLLRLSIPHVVIELNPSTVRRQTALGRTVIFGDASSPEILESAGVRDAALVALTMPDDDAVIRACRTVRDMAPNAIIIARTTYLSKAMLARSFGANEVAVEEIATAEVMERLVTEQHRRCTNPVGKPADPVSPTAP